MSKKIGVLLFLIFGISLFMTASASAHVLISDDTNKVGAVLHVMPDDDPIAGEASDMYFDVQAKDLAKDAVTLTILDIQTGEKAKVDVVVEKNLATATYTFPTQGVYTLEFTVSADVQYSFSYSQRVSRGVEGARVDASSYFIADFALLFSGIAFLVLVVLFINNRKDIKKNSTF